MNNFKTALLSEEELKAKTIEEQIDYKLAIINESRCLSEILYIYLPDVHSEKYYFVSYSHENYKEVYKDIFALEKEGVNIWYDKGMPAGQDWLKTAEDHIEPYECMGILFYISEEALMSPAIFDEIKYCYESGKPFIAITIPFKHDYIYQGENVKGKFLTVDKMVDVLLENGCPLDKKKANDIKKAFNPRIIALDINQPATNKKPSIEANMPKQSLLTFVSDEKGQRYIVTSLNDTNARVVNKADVTFAMKKFIDSVKEQYEKFNPPPTEEEKKKPRPIGPRININNGSIVSDANHDDGLFDPAGAKSDVIVGSSRLSTILSRSILSYKSDVFDEYGGIFSLGECAFANCRRLETLEMIVPAIIGRHCFYNCTRLEKVHFFDYFRGGYPGYYIHESAFENCQNLKEIDLSKVARINKNAFMGCSSLTSVDLSSLRVLEEGAFLNCSSLMQVIFNHNLNGEQLMKQVFMPEEKNKKDDTEGPKFIKENTFKGCSSLKELVIPSSIKTIAANAFAESGIETLYIPTSIENLDGAPFTKMRSLTAINVYGLKNDYYSVDGVVYAMKGEKLLRCPPGLKSDSYIINSKVREIGDFAFESCSLKKIIIGENVKVIGKEAFASSLVEEILISKWVRKIEYDAFIRNDKLKTIYFYGTRHEFLSIFGDGQFSSLTEIEVYKENIKRMEKQMKKTGRVAPVSNKTRLIKVFLPHKVKIVFCSGRIDPKLPN